MEDLLSKLDLKIIIPVLTFIAGIIVTHLLKKYYNKKDLIQHQIKDVTNNVNDWYNQLHSIKKELSKGKSLTSFSNEFSHYLDNRIILPKIRTNLEILSRDKKCSKLIELVEDFLVLVTNYEEIKVQKSIKKTKRPVQFICSRCNAIIKIPIDNSSSSQKPFCRNCSELIGEVGSKEFSMELLNKDSIKHQNTSAELRKEEILNKYDSFLLRLDKMLQQIAIESGRITESK